MATQSMFSPANPSAYKNFKSAPVRGSFGGNPSMGMGMGAPQGNLQAIMDLIKQLSAGQQQQPQDELTRTLNELASPAVTGRF